MRTQQSGLAAAPAKRPAPYHPGGGVATKQMQQGHAAATKEARRWVVGGVGGSYTGGGCLQSLASC